MNPKNPEELRTRNSVRGNPINPEILPQTQPSAVVLPPSKSPKHRRNARKGERGRGFTLAETEDLLHVIETVVLIGGDEWSSV